MVAPLATQGISPVFVLTLKYGMFFSGTQLQLFVHEDVRVHVLVSVRGENEGASVGIRRGQSESVYKQA